MGASEHATPSSETPAWCLVDLENAPILFLVVHRHPSLIRLFILSLYRSVVFVRSAGNHRGRTRRCRLCVHQFQLLQFVPQPKQKSYPHGTLHHILTAILTIN